MLSRKDKERLSAIKENCTKCGGLGALFINKQFVDCECLKIIEKEQRILEANIPPAYTKFKLEDLTEEFKSENKYYLELFTNFIYNLKDNEGKIVWLHSPPGLAKSCLMVWGITYALSLGYIPYFSRATQLLQLKLDALRREDKKEELDYILNRVDILAIDEIDKVYLNPDNFVTSQFYDLFSDVYDMNKTLLISSNVPLVACVSKFPVYIQDRLEAAISIEFSGKSGRR